MNRRHETHTNHSAHRSRHLPLVDVTQSGFAEGHNAAHWCDVLGEHGEVLDCVSIQPSVPWPPFKDRGWKDVRDTQSLDQSPTHHKHPSPASPSSSTSASPHHSNHAAHRHHRSSTCVQSVSSIPVPVYALPIPPLTFANSSVRNCDRRSETCCCRCMDGSAVRNGPRGEREYARSRCRSRFCEGGHGGRRGRRG